MSTFARIKKWAQATFEEGTTATLNLTTYLSEICLRKILILKSACGIMHYTVSTYYLQCNFIH